MRTDDELRAERDSQEWVAKRRDEQGMILVVFWIVLILLVLLRV